MKLSLKILKINILNLLIFIQHIVALVVKRHFVKISFNTKVVSKERNFE